MKYAHYITLIAIVFAAGCTTLDVGTFLSLKKLDPMQIDPRTGRIAVFWPEAFTHEKTPSIDFKVEKDGMVQIEDNAKFITDPESEKKVPNSRNKFFGGPNWDVDWYRNFHFTIERQAYHDYCSGKHKLDISVWVKVNSTMPFQRLIDEKGIDNFVSGQLKEECDNPETFLITQE